MFNVTVHGAGTHRGKMFSCLTSTIAGGRCFNSNAKLTQRHLVNEAEVALHHLGPDQVKRRVNRYPVETVGPHRIAKESWVVGRRRLNHEVHEEQGEKKKLKVNAEPGDLSRRLHKGCLTTNTSPVATSLSTTNRASFWPPILALWPRVRVNQPE